MQMALSSGSRASAVIGSGMQSVKTRSSKSCLKRRLLWRSKCMRMFLVYFPVDCSASRTTESSKAGMALWIVRIDGWKLKSVVWKKISGSGGA
jgi:hypothetical protein